MSTTIDNRVLEMRFDNKQFESGVATSMSTLDKLKQKLNLSGASKGLEDIGKSAKKVDMSGLGRGIETVQAKFSALQVVGVTALTNITNQAVNAGKRMVKALTIDPIKTGFQEYETQMGAVQTILANTESKGSTLQDVNRALAELNTYADKTIYNFTEMTKNIGTFTAAGVDLDKSVTSIKGIANLAAISGSTSQQASAAMYQLSQALAAGKVSLMDWNSVVNAGMGGEVFQNALKRTAENMGHNVDAMIEKYGSFRESLTKGNWLTAEVLTETLTQLSGAYSKADLIAQGYTEKQADDIIKLAETAVGAATEVKTFTQLWDTLKESVQSGWTQSWQTIIGDFGEAKELLTGISKGLSEMVEASANARNKVLTEGLSTGWKQILSKGISDEEGFKDSIKSVAKEHGVAVDKMIEDSGSFEKSLKKGWLTGDILTESLDKMTKKVTGLSAEQLKERGYTEEQVTALKKLNESVKDGSVNMDEFAKKMTMNSGRENMIAGFKNIFDGLVSVIKPVKEAFRDVFPAITGKQLYDFTVKFQEFTKKLQVSGETAQKLKSTFKGVFSIFDLAGKGIVSVIKPIGKLFGSDGVGSMADTLLDITASIGDFFTTLNESADTGKFLDGITDGLSNVASIISDLIGGATEGLTSFGDVLSTIGSKITDFAGKIINGIGKAFTWITENISAGDIFAGLAGGGIFVVLKKLAGLFGKVKDVIDKIFGNEKGSGFFGIAGKFSDVLDGVHDSLESFTSGIKATTILSIAVAIGVLAASLKTISKIKPGDITKSVIAIGAMMTMLNMSFRSITKSLTKFDSKGILRAGFTMISIATAINIFASAMKKVSELSWGEIARGLTALGGGLLELTVALKIIDNVKIPIRTSIALLAIAESCKILGDALSKFGSLSWSEIGRGLSAMGGALAELVISLGVLSKVGGFGSILGGTGILIAVQSLDEISENLKRLGSLSWDEIGRGLSAMGGALGELTLCLGALSAIGGFGAILGGTSILIAVQSLDEISENLKKLGSMTWEEIGKGLSAMGGALGELSLSIGALGKLAGFSGLLGSGAILIGAQSLKPIADALQSIGSLSWEEIGKGLSGMGGALGELSLMIGSLGTISPIGSLLGGGAILIGVQGLGDLADALKKFGEMSWEEIDHGLVAMGGALGELGLISGALGKLAPIGAMVGSGSLLLAIQGLDELANALKKFGEMSWDEIGRGLSAMGAALGETALGGLLNTLSGFGAGAIATIAEPLGALADSVKKWSGVTVPEGLGLQLGVLANGIKSFTFGGLGAGALATAAGPLGTMADSVKKWSGVTVPEGLGGKLKELADGVEAFSFAFVGGWSLSAVTEPLGSLAGAVKKWNGVVIPEGIKGKLKGLADGVEAFSFAFVGGWSINAIDGPLGNLAGAVKKWNGITIPEGMKSKLEGLASGVKAFSGIAVDNLSSVSSGISSIGKAAKSISEINFASIASGLTSFTSSISNIKISTNSFTNLGKQIVSGFVNSLNSGKGRVQAAVNSLANTAINSFVRAVSGASSRSAAAGLTMIRGLTNGLKSGKGTIITATMSIISSTLRTVTSKSASFTSAGRHLMTSLSNGINSGKGRVKSAVTSVVSSAASACGNKYSAFYSAGASISKGLAAGIRSGVSSARAAARELAAAADEAARARLKINSPSKVFRSIGAGIPEGMAQGVTRFGGMVNRAVTSMSSSAVNYTAKSIARISDLVNSDIDTQPTIRPVVDLSNVKTGARSINSILNTGSRIGISANVDRVSSLMSRQNQNGTNDDVVSAINKLGKKLGNTNSTTYNVNGVNVNNNGDVAAAIETLIRAAVIEGRA